MALQVWNPSHSSASSGWVALTETAPWPVGKKILHIRDTEMAIAGSSPNGAGRTATITLPGKPHYGLFSVSAHNGTTLSSATLAMSWVAKGASYAAHTQPTPAGSTAAGIDATVVLNSTDANTFGITTVVPESFQIRATGVTYTGALTTVQLDVEIHLAD